jgi:hypothetical protein
LANLASGEIGVGPFDVIAQQPPKTITTVTTIESRYIGPCTAGLRPDDEIMENGTVVRAPGTKYGAGAAAPDRRALTKTLRDSLTSAGSSRASGDPVCSLQDPISNLRAVGGRVRHKNPFLYLLQKQIGCSI